ncbi:MAG: hypothetical protein ACLGIV_14640 [Actinomycetes bacterium]
MVEKLVLRLAAGEPPPPAPLIVLLGQPLDLTAFDPDDTGHITVNGYDAIRTDETVLVADDRARVYTLVRKPGEITS